MVTIIYLLITALIFFFIGYFVGKSRAESVTVVETRTNNSPDKNPIASASPREDEQKVDEVPTESAPPKESHSGQQPITLLTHPRNDQKDNLTRIKGIGVKIEEGLNGVGVYHFDQIAAWTQENVVWADKKLNLMGRIVREKWIDQSRLLAQGEETEFSKRVDKGKVISSKKES